MGATRTYNWGCSFSLVLPSQGSMSEGALRHTCNYVVNSGGQNKNSFIISLNFAPWNSAWTLCALVNCPPLCPTPHSPTHTPTHTHTHTHTHTPTHIRDPKVTRDLLAHRVLLVQRERRVPQDPLETQVMLVTRDSVVPVDPQDLLWVYRPKQYWYSAAYVVASSLLYRWYSVRFLQVRFSAF